MPKRNPEDADAVTARLAAVLEKLAVTVRALSLRVDALEASLADGIVVRVHPQRNPRRASR